MDIFLFLRGVELRHFYAPAIFDWGDHIASPSFVRPYVRTNNGFGAISFENIGVLEHISYTVFD